MNNHVFDTNTLVSAVIFPNSVPDKALQKAEREGDLVRSLATFLELVEVLQRPKFDKYVSIETRLNFIEKYEALFILYPITYTTTDCRDPKDNKFLELGVSAKCKVIITGDSDLLVLHPYHGISILKAAEFLFTQ